MVVIDKQKRKRIMQRSMKLGHCICDPKKPCPCDMFREQNICLCAGERPEPLDISQVRLTDYVHNAGCASKVPPADLERILARSARLLDVVLDEGACGEIARRSRGTPRVANRLLRRVRDFAQVHEGPGAGVERDVACFALERLDVDDVGFDRLVLAYPRS